MIFQFKEELNFVAEHYEIDFDMIFYFKTAQNLVAEHHERDFGMIFHFMEAQNLYWLRSTMKEDKLIGPTHMAMNKNRFI